MSKLFLLSDEEAEKIPQEILACGDWWWLRSPTCRWLRSPSCCTKYAAYVNTHGCMDDEDGLDIDDIACVRPAIHIKVGLFNSLDRTKKGYIKLGTKPNGKPVKWIDISEYIGRPCLLMKKPIARCRFDAESNDYEKSEIKTRLAELDDILFTDYEKSLFIEDWEVWKDE